MLVIKFRQKTSDLRIKIYRDTLDYIAKSVSNAVVYEYKNDQDLLHFIQKHKFVTVVYTCELSYRTSILLKGLDFIQISIGKNNELIYIVDIIIDPLMKKSYQYLVGTKYILPSIVKKYGAEQIAKILQVDKKSLSEDVSHNQAESELINVVTV